MINVISQSTEERLMETKKLFEAIKPLLDEGYSYNLAVKIICKMRPSTNFSHLSWYKELRDYGASQGYPLKDYMRCKKNGMGV